MYSLHAWTCCLLLFVCSLIVACPIRGFYILVTCPSFTIFVSCKFFSSPNDVSTTAVQGRAGPCRHPGLCSEWDRWGFWAWHVGSSIQILDYTNNMSVPNFCSMADRKFFRWRMCCTQNLIRAVLLLQDSPTSVDPAQLWVHRWCLCQNHPSIPARASTTDFVQSWAPWAQQQQPPGMSMMQPPAAATPAPGQVFWNFQGHNFASASIPCF